MDAATLMDALTPTDAPMDTPMDAPGSPEWFDISKARPAIPHPFEVSGEERIKELEGYLSSNNKVLQRQRANIEHLINMYKTGQLKSLLGPPDGRGIYVCGGKVFEEYPDYEERNNCLVWYEVRSSIKAVK